MKSTLLPLISAVIFTSPAFAANNTVVKIGHVAPLSGPDGHLGKDNENGAKMAIEELNTKGTMIGGQKVVFQLITADDAGDSVQAGGIAKKLADAKVNGVIGHLNSNASIAAAPVYYAAGIPQISPSSTATAYTAMGYGSAFRVVANDAQLGGILGRYAIQTLKANTIAVIDDRTLYGKGVANEFVKGAETEAKVKKVRLDLIRPSVPDNKAPDYGSILVKIKEANPAVIFFGGMDSGAAVVLRQMKALGIKAKLMGGDGICTNTLSKLAGDTMSDGQVVCAEAGGVIDTQKITDFSAAYKKKFNMNVVNYAPYTYDAVMTMADAMQQAKSSQPADYLPFLRNIHHPGITGDIAFNKNGDIKGGTVTLFTFKSSERQSIGILQ